MKEVREKTDPVVGEYSSKGIANGRPVKMGKSGGYYYEYEDPATNEIKKSYLSQRMGQIKFNA